MTEQHDHDLLIELKTKMDILMGRVDTFTVDHETRLRSLETFRWKLFGAVVVVQALAGSLLYWGISRLH